MASFELSNTVQSIIGTAFPKRQVDSIRVLDGGKTNLNILVRIEGCNDTFVVRRYRRGSEVCRKEQLILKALQGKLPVPEWIASFHSDDESGAPYTVYRYVPGHTFREIREVGSPRDMAEAARAIGDCLSTLDRFDISTLSDDGLLHQCAYTLGDLNSPLLRERLDEDDRSLLKELFEQHRVVLQELSYPQGICHGDFNHRNVVLRKSTAGWEVAAILDWELAGTGSILWDVARFTCYAKRDSPFWEDSFLNSVLTSLAKTSDNQRDLLLALNVFGAARSLSGRSVQQIFVPELQRLVHAGLRGERIG